VAIILNVKMKSIVVDWKTALKVVFYILLLSLMGFVLGITFDYIVYDLTHGRVFSWLYTATFTIAFGIIGAMTLALSKAKG